VRVAVLTVSDACARGERADASGDAAAAWAGARAYTVTARATVPDESERIAAQLVAWCDDDRADVVLTTGGTGLAPRDVTPEATRAVLERDAPGIAERLRASVADRFPRAALSRGVAGVRGRALIVNLPGSPGGVRDGLAVLDQFIDHAVAILRDEATDHSSGASA
jgi:molybdenum cofactor synthesis domain-containing protein